MRSTLAGNLEKQINSYFVSLALIAFMNEYRCYAPNSKTEKMDKLKEIASYFVVSER